MNDKRLNDLIKSFKREGPSWRHHNERLERRGEWLLLGKLSVKSFVMHAEASLALEASYRLREKAEASAHIDLIEWKKENETPSIDYETDAMTHMEALNI